MAVKINPAPEPAPAPISPTKEHRTAAIARGQDADVLFSLMHSAIRDAVLIMREVVASLPVDDANRAVLGDKLAAWQGELEFFKP